MCAYDCLKSNQIFSKSSELVLHATLNETCLFENNSFCFQYTFTIIFQSSGMHSISHFEECWFHGTFSSVVWNQHFKMNFHFENKEVVWMVGIKWLGNESYFVLCLLKWKLVQIIWDHLEEIFFPIDIGYNPPYYIMLQH